MKLPDLRGRTAIVTGATNGIGFEAAAELAAAGADVIAVGRDGARTRAAAAALSERAGRTVSASICDFASQASIRTFAAEVLDRSPRIDILVNNAGGVYAERTLTEDGIEATFAVNHLGYFLFTRLLLDRIVQSAPARIVVVASTGHYRGTMDFDDLGFTKGYSIMGAYTRSKLGNVLFTRALARRLEGTGVTVNALHPGGVATNIWTGAPTWTRPVLNLAKWFMLTPAQGADRILQLAASPEVEGQSGLYFSDLRAVKPSPLALDDTVAERLWAESERLVGLAAADRVQ
jgi:NAD(P)-dependent dehydrogenase (short-subunit alcohol dehydrogenase family)